MFHRVTRDRRTGGLGIGLLTALLVAGCSAREPERRASEPTTQPSAPPLTYVAVGASETVGVGAANPTGDAWPRLLLRTALPASTVFVNLGIPGATVAEALRQEVPRAVETRPDLVTVWLNVNDLIAGVSARQYERDLGTLVRSLRRGGATRVLVANVPPLDQLPAYVGCRTAGAGCQFSAWLPSPEALNEVVEAYNAATSRVVEREGAWLVDLHAVGRAATRSGTFAALVSADGFHPSSAGHAAVAQAFAAVFRDSGPLTPSG